MIAIEQRPVSEIVGDVFEGLTKTPKSLPPKLFYDAAGSALFQEITRLPEYYLTRTELKILTDRAEEIAKRCPLGASIVELGSGSSAKTRVLLRALSGRNMKLPYFPVDISAAALKEAKQALRGEMPSVQVTPTI